MQEKVSKKKLKCKTVVVIDTALINRFLWQNYIGLYTLYDMCDITVDDFRKLLAYRGNVDNEIFYKLARILNVPVRRLFNGISNEAKEMLKKYQNPLPCELD